MSSFLFSFLLVYIKLSSFLRTVWGPKTSLLTNTQADPHVSSAEKIYKAYNFLIALPIFLVVWGNTCDLQPTVCNKHLWCTAHSNTEGALYTFPVCCGLRSTNASTTTEAEKSSHGKTRIILNISFQNLHMSLLLKSHWPKQVTQQHRVKQRKHNTWQRKQTKGLQVERRTLPCLRSRT